MVTILLKRTYSEEEYPLVCNVDVLGYTQLEDELIMYDRQMHERIGDYIVVCLN